MLIVDSQIHIWGAYTPERPWPVGHIKPHRPAAYSADDLLRDMKVAQVDRAILVPPMWEGCRNDLALAAVRAHPDRFAIMGRFDLEDPASRGRMAAWRAQPGMLGVRLVPRRPPLRALLADGQLEWFWAEAELAGVPLMVFIDPLQLPAMNDVARRHPGLKLVLDHLCLPKGAKDDAAFAALDQLLAMAVYSNVAVKATTLPIYSSDCYPYRNIHPYLRRVYDAFGPKRMFWGSDITRLPGSYRQAVTMFTEEMPWLSAEDKTWIMGRGICEWLGWPLP